jgi:hypothetical protein|tara:strand:- start:976 stop:1893 length:918 start_codon:yes stop_codon:yes gene_type:complete
MAEEAIKQEVNEDVEIILDDSGSTQEATDTQEQSSPVSEETKEESVAAGAEAQDPSEDEIDQYSKTVQARIKKLVTARRQEERDKEEAIRLAEVLKKENDELRARNTTLNKGYNAQYEGRVGSQLEQAKKAFKDAYDSGDSDAIVAANQAIARITLDEERLRVIKAREEQAAATQQPQEQVQQPEQPAAQPDPKAKAWADRNDWFGSDRVMTVGAYAIHEDLAGEGYDLTSDDYYSELDKRLRVEFPQKFENNASNGGTARVASADSSASRSTKKGRRAVKLTPSQVAIAKKLGVSLEDYAKHVK